MPRCRRPGGVSRSEGVSTHAINKNGPVRTIVEGDLFLSARSSFFFLLSSLFFLLSSFFFGVFSQTFAYAA